MLRDIDLVLFNSSTLAGNSRVFPGGHLREPISALSRAHAFILTGVSDTVSPEIPRFSRFLQENFPDRPVFLSSYRPADCREVNSPISLALETIPSPLYGFCGIAHPSRFQETLKGCGITLNGFTALKDHQSYSPKLLKKINDSAKMAGAKALITTEKDLVKLRTLPSTLPLFSISMKVEFEKSFSHFLLQKLTSCDHIV